MASENVGAIYYTVEANTEKLLAATKPADKSLDNLNKRFGKTDKAANAARFQMTKTAAAIKGMGRSADQTTSAFKALLPVISAAALLQLGREVIGLADAWTEMQNRLRQVTKTSQQLAQATDDVFRIAQETSQEMEPVVQVYQRLAQNAEKLGIGQKKVAEITEIVSKAVAASGASAEAASASLRQLGQGLASGTLRGDELNSVMEQTPALAQAIATGLGVTIGELRNLGAQGKITSKALIEGLSNAAESVDQQFGTRVKTVSMSWTELKNSVSRFVGEANNASNVTSSLAGAIDDLSDAIDNVDIDNLAQNIEGLKATAALVRDGIEAVFDAIGDSADTTGADVSDSFTDMALNTAKEVDGIAKVFQGTAGAIEAVWKALANNIPAFFENAYNSTLAGAASFVNRLADTINKPIQALGGEGIGHVDWGATALNEIVSLSDAAQKGWDNAAKGVGAYDTTLKRVTDNAIWSSINDWQSTYTSDTDTATEATKNLGSATGKLTAAQKKAISAHKQNAKTIATMAASLYEAGLEGQALAEAKAAAQLNVFATPEEIARVKALAGALYEVQQAKADKTAIEQADPAQAEIDRYAKQLASYQDMLNRKSISQEQYNTFSLQAEADHNAALDKIYTDHWETAADLEAERYQAQMDGLTTALDTQMLTYEDYFARYESLYAAHAARVKKIESAKSQVLLSSNAQAFGELTSAVGSFVGEQNGFYKTLFAASKAFAIAQASILIERGIAGAWALPFPANLVAVAKVVSGTASILSNISAVSLSLGGGKQYGGPVDSTGMYRVNENGKPEVLSLNNGRQYLLPNSRGEVISNKDAARDGGSATTHSTIINFSPTIQTSWPMSDKDVREMVERFNEAISDGMKLRTT